MQRPKCRNRCFCTDYGQYCHVCGFHYLSNLCVSSQQAFEKGTLFICQPLFTLGCSPVCGWLWKVAAGYILLKTALCGSLGFLTALQQSYVKRRLGSVVLSGHQSSPTHASLARMAIPCWVTSLMGCFFDGRIRISASFETAYGKQPSRKWVVFTQWGGWWWASDIAHAPFLTLFEPHMALHSTD